MKRATVFTKAQYTIDNISIHALVKRATMFSTSAIVWSSISIHALVKRATTGKHKNPKISSHFNPRPREEGDQALLDR